MISEKELVFKIKYTDDLNIYYKKRFLITNAITSIFTISFLGAICYLPYYFFRANWLLNVGVVLLFLFSITANSDYFKSIKQVDNSSFFNKMVKFLFQLMTILNFIFIILLFAGWLLYKFNIITPQLLENI